MALQGAKIHLTGNNTESRHCTTSKDHLKLFTLCIHHRDNRLNLEPIRTQLLFWSNVESIGTQCDNLKLL